ncbi:HEPN domain-containing protein [Candidatus Woesearchaeota archaeon]|nr:HEPN domain-containing protein [Candidatus Woesearchaeota archaeon]
MKKINFLIRLKEEGRLSIIDPSEEVKESYIRKSASSLKSAEILLESEQIEDAVPMAYYSMYNMLTALFFKAGIKCENHSASIIILKELFGIDNSKIMSAKTERVDKQYYVDFKITKEEVGDMIKSAEQFNSMLYDFSDKLTTKEALEYRKELEDSLVN